MSEPLSKAAASPHRRESMHTQTLQGVAPADNDDQVLAAIARAARDAAQGPTTVVGIRNGTGSIYRVVHAVGAAESLALASSLEDIGLVDERREIDRVREGCDSIFGVPNWLSSQAAPLDKAAMPSSEDTQFGFVISQGAELA